MLPMVNPRTMTSATSWCNCNI